MKKLKLSVEMGQVHTEGYLTQVKDNTGRFLNFEYILPFGVIDRFAATGGLVSKITNAAGQIIAATYDTNLNLVALTWPDNKAQQFLYENLNLPWAMTGVLDENSSRSSSWNYDERGLANSTTSGSGANAYSVSYATRPQASVIETIDQTLNLLYRRLELQPAAGALITGPNGQVFSMDSVSILGAPALTSSSQPAGSGCVASTNALAFDARGNIILSDDFKGHRTCFAYDNFNREIARVEGLANTVTCESAISGNSILPSGARKITTEWHPDWRLPTKVSEAGRVTTTVYNGLNDSFTSSLANCSPAGSMSNGKPLPLVCKTVVQSFPDSGTQTTTYNYDDSGHLLTTTDAIGNQQNIQYIGSVDSTLDPNFDRVSVLLHGEGDNGSVAFVDSSSPAKTLSVAYGAPSVSTSKSQFGAASLYFNGSSSIKVVGAGGTTFWGSDWTVEFAVLPGPLNQGPASVFGNRQGGGGQLYLYYSGGSLTNILFELGESGQYPGFGVSTSTPGFNSAVSAVGSFNRIAVVKQGTTYIFFLNGVKLDAVTRGVQPTPSPFEEIFIGAANQDSFYPYYFNGYIDELRITMGAARYDKNYILRTAAFPDKGASSASPIYLHDIKNIRNAAGHLTQMTSYDLLGRVLQFKDSKGITTDVSYTPRGWVSSVVTTALGASPRTTNYTYDGVGQLTQTSLPDGTSLSYRFDSAHRLIGVADARGNTVNYTLDNAGNRISEDIRDVSGGLTRSITRSFDALNRVQQVSGSNR
jgi:YD repeat-containing protein